MPPFPGEIIISGAFYPKKVVEALNGVENWRDKDLSKLRDELNQTQWHSLAALFDVLTSRLKHMSASQH